jgi:hypothetical protein
MGFKSWDGLIFLSVAFLLFTPDESEVGLVKFSLYFIVNYYAMEAYGGVEV